MTGSDQLVIDVVAGPIFADDWTDMTGRANFRPRWQVLQIAKAVAPLPRIQIVPVDPTAGRSVTRLAGDARIDRRWQRWHE
jgi:hypothetical protein